MADNVWMSMFDKYLTERNNANLQRELQGNQIFAQSELAKQAEAAALQRTQETGNIQKILQAMQDQAAMMRQDAQLATQKDIAEEGMFAGLLPNLGSKVRTAPSGTPGGLAIAGQTFQAIPLEEQISDLETAKVKAHIDAFNSFNSQLSIMPNVTPEEKSRWSAAFLMNNPAIAQEPNFYNTILNSVKIAQDPAKTPQERKQAENFFRSGLQMLGVLHPLQPNSTSVPPTGINTLLEESSIPPSATPQQALGILIQTAKNNPRFNRLSDADKARAVGFAIQQWRASYGTPGPTDPLKEVLANELKKAFGQ